MTREEALTLLGLSADATEPQISQTLDSRLADLDTRIAQASSDSLRDKFVQNRELLQQARATLAGSTDIDLAALPIAERHAGKGSGQRCGPYRLLGALGSTPDASGFEASHDGDGHAAVLVRIDRRLNRPELRQLDIELGELSRITSPVLQPLLDYQLDEDCAFLVLAPPLGRPLQEQLDTLDDKQRRSLAFRLCEAVGEMHRHKAHGALDSQSVYLDGEAIQLTRPALSGLQLPPAGRAYSNRAPSRERDLQDLGGLLARLFNPHCDPGADLASCTARLPAPLRKVFTDLASGDRERRPASAQELASRLRQALAPAPSRWLRSPVFRFAVVPALLLAVIFGLFQQQITDATDSLWTSAEEKALQHDSVLKGLTEAENLLAGHERALDKLGQEIERLQQQLDDSRSDTRKRKLIPELTKKLLLKQDILDHAESVIARTELANLKGEVAVIKQRLSAEQLDEAQAALQRLLPRVQAANNLIPTLEELVETDERIADSRSRLGRLDTGAADPVFLAEAERLEQLQRDLLARQQPQAALSDGAKPLARLYTARLAELEQQRQDAAAARLKRLVAAVKKDLVKLPAGSFRMGYRSAGAYDARPIHNVRLASFSISRHPVTNSLYRHFRAERSRADDRMPATGMDWAAAASFSDWLGKAIGMSCRLPTEAEWEYAARSGLSGDYPWGKGMPAGKANCADCNGSKGPTLVGSYPANQHGLYDMYGNVWEWVQDCYVDNYRNAPANGSAVEFEGCKRRVLRGGAWNSPVRETHPAYRNAAKPDFSSDTIGFRFVCR